MVEEVGGEVEGEMEGVTWCLWCRWRVGMSILLNSRILIGKF
jgi:hypothetical protein